MCCLGSVVPVCSARGRVLQSLRRRASRRTEAALDGTSCCTVTHLGVRVVGGFRYLLIGRFRAGLAGNLSYGPGQ